MHPAMENNPSSLHSLQSNIVRRDWKGGVAREKKQDKDRKTGSFDRHGGLVSASESPAWPMGASCLFFCLFIEEI
jgi:hypothetical protein